MNSDQFQKNSMNVETPEASVDGAKMKDESSTMTNESKEQERTGTWVTAIARIITAAIGLGVLSVAWAIAQVGWVAGPAVLFAFSLVTYFTSTLVADCYRSPDPVHGGDYTFSDVVRSVLELMRVLQRLLSLPYSTPTLSISLSIYEEPLPPLRCSAGNHREDH